MRDLLVTLIVFASLPFILARPCVGIYMWSWISYMNPHRLAWGFAADFPFAYIIALTTFAAMLFSKEPKRLPWTRETIVLLIFTLWMLVTTFFALHQDLAWAHMTKVAKIQLMTFVTLMLINSRERVHALIWVIAMSLGFYGVKGGIFTLMHGGVYEVRGPLDTFIGGNNEIGLALIMVIPLIRYLQLQAEKAWVRTGLVGAMLLSAIGAIGSQSRGALIGSVAMATFLWLKSRKKLVTALMVVAAAGTVYTIMPAKWYEKIATIETYELDSSAMGRINAWGFALNLAKARPLVGGGFDAFQADSFAVYAPDPEDVHDAHSIYFEVLGEHGFAGLALFLALGLFVWRSGSWIIRHTRADADRKWARDLAAMIQVSLVGYAVSGAFLGLAYFDFYYHLIAIIVITRQLLQQAAVVPLRILGTRRADSRPKRRLCIPPHEHPLIRGSGTPAIDPASSGPTASPHNKMAPRPPCAAR